MELIANRHRVNRWGGGPEINEDCGDTCITYVYLILNCVLIVDEFCDMKLYLNKL